MDANLFILDLFTVQKIFDSFNAIDENRSNGANNSADPINGNVFLIGKLVLTDDGILSNNRYLPNSVCPLHPHFKLVANTGLK